MSARNRRALRRSLVPLAMMGLIFYVSSLPADTDAAWWEPAARNVGHVAGYMGLTLLWSWALAGVVSHPVAVAAAISLAYACTDEYHQTFVENRDGTASDVAIDAVGIALAALLISRLRSSGRLAQA